MELPDSTSTWLFDNPQRLKDRYLERRGDMVNRAEILGKAIGSLQPQTILESILSEEWENWGESRWLAALPKLRADLDARIAGKSPAERALSEFDASCAMYTRLLVRFDEGRADRLTICQFVVRRLSQRLTDAFHMEARILGRAGPRLISAYVKRYREALQRWSASLEELQAGGVKFWVDREIGFCELLQGSEADSSDKRNSDFSDLFVVAFRLALKAFPLALAKESPWPSPGQEDEGDAAFLQLLATTYQKSYLAVRRSMIANPGERDHLFPSEDCRIDGWFDASSLNIGGRS